LEGGAKFLRRDPAKMDPLLSSFARQYVTPGLTVWDVGANVGLFTFMAAGLAKTEGSVLAVEADTWLAGNLRRAVLRNVGCARVDVLPAAVSATLGVADFVTASSTRATSYLAESGGSTMTGGVREKQIVPTVTLDCLLDRFGPPHVLKIDVEGGEVEVLRGASLTLAHRPILLVEVYERSAIAVHELLAPHGYHYLDAQTLQTVDLPSDNVIALPSGSKPGKEPARRP